MLVITKEKDIKLFTCSTQLRMKFLNAEKYRILLLELRMEKSLIPLGFSLLIMLLDIQEVFHVFFNKFEIAVSHSFLIIFSNNKFTLVNPFSRNGQSPEENSS